jgi:hypothetical protein
VQSQSTSGSELGRSESTIVVLDPRSRPDVGATISARLASLSDVPIGILWNNRPRGDILLRGVGERLTETHRIRPVHRSKLRVGSGAPIEEIKQLSNEVQAVIIGVGD